MTSTLIPFGATSSASALRRSSRNLHQHVRNLLIGLALSLIATAIVYADEMPQGWVPEGLSLPNDAEITMDRAVGSSIRIFSFNTGVDIKQLFEKWTAVLEKDGYSIRPQQADFAETVIEFSGPKILNAKIASEISGSGDRKLITFDATLD